MEESRRERGRRIYREVLQKDPPERGSVYRLIGELDQIYAEVWARTDLPRKDRRWITLACLACRQAERDPREHVHGALASGDITIDEMSEAVHHVATYGGFARGQLFDEIVCEVAGELGLSLSDAVVLSSPETSREERLSAANVVVREVSGPIDVAAVPESTRLLVYGETWARGVLSRRERRVLTLACAAMSSVAGPTSAHWNAATEFGELSHDEAIAFAEHFHAYAGGPQSGILPKH